jgi:hypothetical protein
MAERRRAMAESANPARRAWLSGQADALRATFGGLTLYEQFEHAIIIVLTVLIIAVVASATWHLALMVLILLFTDEIRPDNQAVFQTVFGMIFTFWRGRKVSYGCARSC